NTTYANRRGRFDVQADNAARLLLSRGLARPGRRGARLRWSRARQRPQERARLRQRALASPAPEARSRLLGRGFLAERSGTGEEVRTTERHQLGPLEAGQLGTLHPGEPQRLCIERLLEERPRKPRVAEALAAGRAAEDPTQHVRGLRV